MTIDASICKCMIYSLRKDIYSWVYATLCTLLIRSMMMVVRVPLEERWCVGLPLRHWQPLIAFSLANVVSRSRSTSPLARTREGDGSSCIRGHQKQLCIATRAHVVDTNNIFLAISVYRLQWYLTLLQQKKGWQNEHVVASTSVRECKI